MRAGIRSRPWAGLDVGSYSVKLLATMGGVVGSRFWMAEEPLPPLNGESARSPETVSRAIAACFERARLTTRSVHGVSVGVAGSDVIVKQIRLPLMDDNEVAAALRFEARKHLPFDPDSMIIDFQILGRSTTDKRVEILLAAVSQDRMQRQLQPLRALGIDADIVDAAPLALTNALVHHADVNRDAQLLLDIGHTSSHFMVFQRGSPFFTRRIDFGGLQLTEAIARGTQVPLDEAEEFKLAAGSDEPTFRVDWEIPAMKVMLDCIRTELVDEVRRSLAFYRTIAALPEPFSLWISGGSARLPGLAAHLTDMLAMPVLLFNPIDQIAANDPRGGKPPVVGPQFAQALGLALRSRM